MFRTLLYSSNNMLGKSCKGDVRHSECHYKEDSRDRFRDIDTTPPFPAGSVILNSRDAALKCSAASEIRLAHEAQTCLPRKRGLTLRDLSKERKRKNNNKVVRHPGPGNGVVRGPTRRLQTRGLPDETPRERCLLVSRGPFVVFRRAGSKSGASVASCSALFAFLSRLCSVPSSRYYYNGPPCARCRCDPSRASGKCGPPACLALPPHVGRQSSDRLRVRRVTCVTKYLEVCVKFSR